MDKINLLFCSFISYFIIVHIVFEFLNARYFRTYRKKYIYVMLPIFNVIVMMLADMAKNPVFSVSAGVLSAGIISFFFYGGHEAGKFIRVLETEALFMMIRITEAAGVFMVNLYLHLMQITFDSTEIQESIEIAFSKTVLMFFYYAVITKLWKKSNVRTGTQFILCFIMMVYSMINVFAGAAIAQKENHKTLLLLMGCIIFANMYLCYLIKFLYERNEYKLKVEMLKQQEKMQYQNYEIQRDKYRQAVTILHDVEKHIKMIERMYEQDLKKEAVEYTKQISNMLKPLVPVPYTDNPILNCLLTDKMREAREGGIELYIEVSDADINFMKPVNVTALFGNLIDNALTASKECDGKKYVGFILKEYNDMISVRIENTISGPVKLENGKIAEPRGGKRGIGLYNIQRCVNEYEGNIIYKQGEGILVCDVFLNRMDMQEMCTS